MARSKLLLEAHLKALRLPTFLREYDKLARQCAAESLDSRSFLQQLCELELLDREQRATERRIKAAKFPVTKSLDTFDFPSLPALNKKLVLELARCEFIDRRENVLALGNSGTGKTHIGLALGLAACQRGYRTRFTTAAALVNELLEARDERRLLRCQKQLAKQDLLIVDELGYVPLSKTGAELLFEMFSQRYEQGSTLVTSEQAGNGEGQRLMAQSQTRLLVGGGSADWRESSRDGAPRTGALSHGEWNARQRECRADSCQSERRWATSFIFSRKPRKGITRIGGGHSAPSLPISLSLSNIRASIKC